MGTQTEKLDEIGLFPVSRKLMKMPASILVVILLQAKLSED